MTCQYDRSPTHSATLKYYISNYYTTFLYFLLYTSIIWVKIIVCKYYTGGKWYWSLQKYDFNEILMKLYTMYLWLFCKYMYNRIIGSMWFFIYGFTMNTYCLHATWTYFCHEWHATPRGVQSVWFFRVHPAGRLGSIIAPHSDLCCLLCSCV